jgi:gamma-D-glutamyl-{L}-meso-diaminopimelate peptidase I (EC:3.4.19.11). Metallo peptidase. MEROPS family M14C
MKVKVRSGDTLWKYSRWFGIPPAILEDANPHVKPESLSVGEEIAIPGFLEETYTIERGDTLYQLARRRNVSLQSLLLLNPGLVPENIPAGIRIRLPRRVTAPILSAPDSYTFEKLEEDILRLQGLYPFIRAEKIGRSVNGLPIYEIMIGRGERVIHFNGSFHANEWITTPVLMHLINTYLLALCGGGAIRGVQVLPLYNANTLSVVPMVNPDGVNLVLKGPEGTEERERLMAINGGSTDFSRWKANIRGVDLNNQFPANWEIEKERKEPKFPAPRDYPGESPLTEPEAIAMADLAQRRQFARLFAFHTQGKEFYWGYEGFEPPESEWLAQELAKVSGYLPVRYVDSHAGYKDWFIMVYRRPGFTFELGLGENPLPISQFSVIVEEMLGVFLVALYR